MCSTVSCSLSLLTRQLLTQQLPTQQQPTQQLLTLQLLTQQLTTQQPLIFLAPLTHHKALQVCFVCRFSLELIKSITLRS